VDPRETLRALTTELIQRLRGETGVPQALYELLDVLSRRLDRIELGAFDTPDEQPTKPERRLSSGAMPATSAFAKANEILKKGKE